MRPEVRILVIGVGNPLLADDGVGFEVARRIGEALAGRGDVTVATACAGGLSIAERMVGFDRAVLVDATEPISGRPGTLHALSLGGEIKSWNTLGTHDADLATALLLLAEMGERVPERIDLLGIEAADLTTFQERLTPEVARVVPLAVERVLGLVGSQPNARCP